MVLAKRLTRVMGDVLGEAQTCAIPGRTIHDILHFILYSLDLVDKKSGKGGVLVHLDRPNPFDRV